MTNKKYKGVFRDEKGIIFYQATLGRDLFTNKIIKKKGRKDKNGKPFKNEKKHLPNFKELELDITILIQKKTTI